ncbi:MAG: site-specific integrase [Vampirovibrionales bacterium]|nr:site-specific integrase [Vampirovibrionales bacterium]
MQEVITNRLLSSLKPQAKPYEIRDTQLKGLLLRIQPSGIMAYYLEYRRGKRVRIGRADAITPSEARDLAKANLSDAYKGNDPAIRKRLAKAETFKQFLEDTYQRWLLTNQRSGKMTYDRLDKVFASLHTVKLNEINPWLIEKWRSKRLKDGIKPSTINREMADLKACLRRATEWGLIKEYPLAQVKPCKVDLSPKIRYLSVAEEESLRVQLVIREETLRVKRASGNAWRKARGKKLRPSLEGLAFADYLKPVVLLSINTGLRRGEVFGLKWSDIDFKLRSLTVAGTIAKSGKTRHVPLNDEAWEALDQWRKQSSLSSQLVFQRQVGQSFHDVRSSWSKVLKDAKITGFRWHDLRHTFASKLVMAGVDLNTVRELLGHSDYKMTLRYAHLAPEHKAAAVAKLLLKPVTEEEQASAS